MKILWFVDNDKKRWIIWKIKDKYYQFYKIFFDYFNETILKNSFFNESNWNYLNFYKKMITKIYFSLRIMLEKVVIGYLILMLFIIENLFIHLKNVY